MGHLLSFSIVSSILLTTMYLAYKWALSSENYHRVNRVILWSIYIVSLFAMPLSDPISHFVTRGDVATSPGMDIDSIVALELVDIATPQTFPWLEALTWVYTAGIAITFLLTVANFIRLTCIIRKGEQVTVCGRKVTLIDDDTIAPFSFCHTIVIPKADFINHGEVIFLHEKSHVELCHWIDLLFSQAVCILQWFNPAAWLMREEMKTVHEYQADARVIAYGTNPKEYQMLLIKKAVGARFPSLANSLNHSKLKKRITMMYKSDSAAGRRLRPLLLIPALGIALWVSQLPAVASALSTVSTTELTSTQAADKVSDNSADPQIHVSVAPANKANISKITLVKPTSGESDTPASTHVVISEADSPEKQTAKEDDSKQVFSTPEQVAEFPGGLDAMRRYVISNLKYPAGTEGMTGRVVVKFVVEKDGSIGDVKVLRSVDPRLDAEAIRVVKSFPKWTPGKLNGKPVASWYALPVSFKAVDDNKSETNASNPSFTSTSVSTSTDASGKTTTSTTKVIGYAVEEDGTRVNIISTADGEPVDYVVFVDGEKYSGKLNDIIPGDIKSMQVVKEDGKKPEIHITTKKK